MFCYAVWIVIELVGKIEPAIGRQLVKRVDLAFAALQRCADVFLRKFVELYITRLQPRDSKVVKLGITELARIFAIQPVEFVRVECRRAASDILEIKNPDDFVYVDLLPIVFW